MVGKQWLLFFVLSVWNLNVLHHWYLLHALLDLQVNPQLEGDNRAHFFTYWTVSSVASWIVVSFFLSFFCFVALLISKSIFWCQSDGYQKTGCYNLVCQGFVQTSTRLTPGKIYTLSTLSLEIYKVGKIFPCWWELVAFFVLLLFLYVSLSIKNGKLISSLSPFIPS